MSKYSCDICCDIDDNQGKSYYGYNSNYGYCDKPECQEEADKKDQELRSESFNLAIESGDFNGAFDAIGDGDIFDLI